MSLVLAAEKYVTGTAKAVRLASRVPAVIYGHGKETINISIDKQDFRRAYRSVGKSTLLDVDFSGKKIPTLVHVIDTHPVSGDPIHVDFHAVNMKEEVHAVVPVRLTGTPDAVKLLGGILTVMHDRIEIKCLPKNLLGSVEFSLEKLKTFNDSITVADLPFPEEITVLDSPETVVASVSAPRVSTDDEEAPSDDEESSEEKSEEEKKEE